MNFKHKKLKDDVNLTEYEVTVEYEELKPFYEEAYNVLSKEVKIEGFRPGKAPRNLVEPKLGIKLLNEAIGRLLPKVAYEVIEKEDKKPTGVPDYEVTKIDPKEGIIFKFNFLNYPEVKLGDWKKIKVKREEIKVTTEDIDDVVKSIIRSSIKPERIKELTTVKHKASSNKASNESKTKNSKPETQEDHDHSHDHDHKHEDSLDFELNDALVAELKYEKEKTLEDVRKAVKERLEEMRKQQNEEKYVSDVIEQAIELSKFEIPERFIQDEVKASEADFDARLKDLNLDPELYLTTQGSSREKKREEWKEQAKKRVASDLILVNVAMQNDKLPLEEDIDSEINKIEDAKIKSSYETEQGRRYIRGVITRQRGLDILLQSVESK